MGGELTAKRELEFSEGSLDAAPHMNFAGTRIYFNSRRPLPGRSQSDGKLHTWYAEKRNGKWSEAKPVERLNLDGIHTAYTQELADGSLVFQSDRPGSVKGGSGAPSLDLWIAKRRNGGYLEPENLSEVNSEDHEGSFVISRNGNLLIFTRALAREMQVYVSVRRQGVLQKPRKLHLTSAPGFVEQSPRLSPDGKTFYFAHNFVIMHIPLRELLTRGEATRAGASSYARRRSIKR